MVYPCCLTICEGTAPGGALRVPREGEGGGRLRHPLFRRAHDTMIKFWNIRQFLLGQQEKICVQIPLDVKGKLFVSPMPFGPYDTQNVLLKIYKRNRIEFVVVLVTDDELREKARKGLLAIYQANNIRVLRLPVADYTSPDLHQMTKVVDKAAGYLRAGAHVAVHCNAGVGRTGVVTCCIVRDIMKIPAQESILYVKQYMQTNMTDEQMRLVGRFTTLIEEVEAKAKQRKLDALS